MLRPQVYEEALSLGCVMEACDRCEIKHFILEVHKSIFIIADQIQKHFEQNFITYRFLIKLSEDDDIRRWRIIDLKGNILFESKGNGCSVY